MSSLVAAMFDSRFDADGVYLLSMVGGHTDDGVPIEFNTFFIVEGGALFGAKQREGPITVMREHPPKDIVGTLKREELDDPAGLVNLLRDPRVSIKLFA